MELFKTKKLLLLISLFFAIEIQTVIAATSAIMATAKEFGKQVNILSINDKTPKLLPDSQFAEDTENFIFKDISKKTGYAAESLYYVNKDELVSKSKNSNKTNIDTGISSVSKVVRSISKMKGMQYYSNSRKRYETLYNESYRIENLNSRTPLEDDLEGSSDGKSYYVLQDEHTFGEAVYKVQYRENKNTVAMKFNNETNLYYGIIKAVEIDKCRIAVNIIDDGDGYYIYLGIRVDCSLPGFLKEKMNKSFQARLDALYNWITLQF